MMRSLAMAGRIIQQIFKDRRTLALMMVAPLFVLTLVYFLFQPNSDQPVTIGVQSLPTELTESLAATDIELIEYSQLEDIKETIIDDELAAFAKWENNTLHITYDASATSTLNLVKAQWRTIQQTTFMKEVNTVLEQSVRAGAVLPNDLPTSIELVESYVNGSADTTFFETISPFLIGFFVFFFVFLISGISLLRERITGTLDRLLATPIKRSDIVLGYLIGYGSFAIIQTILIVSYSVYVLGINIDGSISLVILTNTLIAFVALSLGLLLSTFANSELQMVQFIPIIVIPQMFFAGLLPIETMQGWLQVTAKLMPLYYGGGALKDIMLLGQGMESIAIDLLILVAIALTLSLINVIALKRYRRI